MALPQDLFDKAVELFGRKFLFLYPDGKGKHYGICSECGNIEPYDNYIPTEEDRKYKSFAADAWYECSRCKKRLEIRKGWYSKHGLKDRFYLQAWEVLDHDTVKLHEAIIDLEGRSDDSHSAGAWECETCWDQRCTTLIPGKCETVRWNGETRRVSSVCSAYEQMGCNITWFKSVYQPFTDVVCTMGISELSKSFCAPFLAVCRDKKIKTEYAPNYIMRMNEEPITELFMKAGYKRIAEERAYKLTPAKGTRHIDFSVRSPKKMFRGLKKNNAVQKMKELMQLATKNVSIEQLEMCADMFTNGIISKPEDAAVLIWKDMRAYEYKNLKETFVLCGNFPVSRVIGYLGQASESVTYYLDYLRMAEELGRPMYEKATIFPDDLTAAHDACAKEKEYIYKQETIKKARKRHSYLVERGYEWSSGGVCTVVPDGADDIKREGKALHHCVGGYADQHANGTTNIIFIRRASEPDKPWFTLEVDPKTRRFRQCYGDHNRVKGTDDPDVGPFLKKYAKHLERCFKKKLRKVQEDNKCRKTA